MPTSHVVQLSGGLGSFAAALRVKEQMPAGDELELLFADTLIEDDDLYRFLDDIERVLETPITRLTEGRTPMQVFRDRRFLGNTLIDPCSKYLKRDFLRTYIEEHHDPETTIVYLGIGPEEVDRYERAKPRWEPWVLEAPMLEPPYLGHYGLIDLALSLDVAPPRLYSMGWRHNNCGGTCIKAGKGDWNRARIHFPERYAEWEAFEDEMLELVGKKVTILRDRRDLDGDGGKTKPESLREFRLRMEDNDGQLSMAEEMEGGCGGGCGF